MAAFSDKIVEIKCDPHKILNNTYLYQFFCSKFKSYHKLQGIRFLPKYRDFQQFICGFSSSLNLCFLNFGDLVFSTLTFLFSIRKNSYFFTCFLVIVLFESSVAVFL